MVRIGQHFAAHAHQASHNEGAENPHAGQLSTLYRGVRFTYGTRASLQSNIQRQNTKKMVAQLARRCRPARGKRQAGLSDDTADADDLSFTDDLPQFEISDDGQRRDARQQGGRDDERDDENDTKPTVTFKNGRRRQSASTSTPSLPATGLPVALDHDTNPQMLRDACTREFLALQAELAARKGSGLASCVYAWSMRWLNLLQSSEPLHEADLEALRSHASNEDDTAIAAPPSPDSIRTFNLLAGLLLRQFDRPRTPRQCAVALATVRAMWRTP